MVSQLECRPRTAASDVYAGCRGENGHRGIPGLDAEAFWMTLPLPPLFGLFHGVLLGAVGGALCGLDSDAGVSATVAAALGLVIGPVFVALIAALTLACIVHPRAGLPVPA